MSDLKASLLKVEGSPEGTRYYRNPEGPQAWDRIQSLEDALEKAREALRPFAEASGRLHSGYDDGIAAGDSPMVRVFVSDLRRAAQTLSALEGK